MEDESGIDFSSAAMYVVGLQAVVGVLSSSVVSILACWILPTQAVSAVRTLTLSTIAGCVCIFKPIRLARVAGLNVVFDSLRPAVPLYLACLVLEQLVHTCTNETTASPSWRRVVFGGASLVMLCAGMARAKNPLENTDVPFLLCVGALLVVAMLPPPAVALAGPLCEGPTMFSAAERVVRAISFASVFCCFVFVSMNPAARNGKDSVVTVIRAFTSSVWTLSSPAALLFLAIPQCALAVWSRLKGHEKSYLSLPTASPPPEAKPPSPAPASPTPSENPTLRATPSFGPLTLRDVSAPPRGLTKTDLERIAAGIQE
jgi:hypothetical protein